MALTPAERVAAHRARQQEKLARSERMEAALLAIIEQIGETEKPAALKIVKLAKEGLA